MQTRRARASFPMSVLWNRGKHPVRGNGGAPCYIISWRGPQFSYPSFLLSLVSPPPPPPHPTLKVSSFKVPSSQRPTTTPFPSSTPSCRGLCSHSLLSLLPYLPPPSFPSPSFLLLPWRSPPRDKPSLGPPTSRKSKLRRPSDDGLVFEATVSSTVSLLSPRWVSRPLLIDRRCRHYCS